MECFTNAQSALDRVRAIIPEMLSGPIGLEIIYFEGRIFYIFLDRHKIPRKSSKSPCVGAPHVSDVIANGVKDKEADVFFERGIVKTDKYRIHWSESSLLDIRKVEEKFKACFHKSTSERCLTDFGGARFHQADFRFIKEKSMIPFINQLVSFESKGKLSQSEMKVVKNFSSIDAGVWVRLVEYLSGVSGDEEYFSEIDEFYLTFGSSRIKTDTFKKYLRLLRFKINRQLVNTSDDTIASSIINYVTEYTRWIAVGIGELGKVSEEFYRYEDETGKEQAFGAFRIISRWSISLINLIFMDFYTIARMMRSRCYPSCEVWAYAGGIHSTHYIGYLKYIGGKTIATSEVIEDISLRCIKVIFGYESKPEVYPSFAERKVSNEEFISYSPTENTSVLLPPPSRSNTVIRRTTPPLCPEFIPATPGISKAEWDLFFENPKPVRVTKRQARDTSPESERYSQSENLESERSPDKRRRTQYIN